ncbi:MAG: hypothetical protein P1Q69_12735 [Candidatus Thorarchaeota archaeon]|nr:hypothetical protein [Candidatus Thorarchaeota archaeon]
MSTVKKSKGDDSAIATVTVYTLLLHELNSKAQDAVRDFALHDIDDTDGLEVRRIAMHDAFTTLYDEVANFSEAIMGEEFDLAYLRNRLATADGETREQLEEALKEIQEQSQNNLAEVWMAKVMAWLHQAAAASGPFVESEHEDKEKNASRHLAAVYTMLEKPFPAIVSSVDGTQKLRRVALGYKAYSLIKESVEGESNELSEILGKNKSAEAEFFDEFVNELIGQESVFRQAFNPFDELIWRDILSSFIFEQATYLYNEAIPHYKKSKTRDKQALSTLRAWKNNTAGLSEVYLGMTYNGIADAQMRAGNLEDASKLYTTASDAFGRAEKLFAEIVALQSNADQSRMDKEQKKAQAYFCKAESAVRVLSDLLVVNNIEEAFSVLKEIFKDLKKSEKLAKTRELTGAIRENLRIFSFVEELLKKKPKDAMGITEQISFAQDLRKEGLIQDVHKALDSAAEGMNEEPSESLESIREALISLGILLSLEADDKDVVFLRNHTLSLLNHVKYVIQFKLSSNLQHGVKFIMSRILENLHAAEAASYYRVIGNSETADELTDLGKLALSTAYASEAQVFGRQSEQWAFRAQVERTNSFARLEDELAIFDDDNENIETALKAHDATILRIQHAVSAFESAAKELGSVSGELIRKKNNVDSQVQQLMGVVMKYRGDELRLEGARNDFMGEYLSRKGDKSKASRYFDDAKDQLREAVGNYNSAALVFQQVGDMQAAHTVDGKAKTADLLARGIWDNRQRVSQDQEPMYKGETELVALYLGGTGE